MTGAEGQTSVGDDVRAAVAKLSAQEVDTPVVENVDTTEPVEVVETPTETVEQKAARERDEAGRFAKKKDEPVVTDQTVPLEPAPVVDLKPPASLKPGIKAKWNEIPEDVRQEFIRLESTQQKGMQKVAEDANYGRTLRDVVSPHEATFRALGISAPQALDGLLKADYTLRTAHPREKAQYLLQLAQNYGADMSIFQGAEGQNQQPAQVDPTVKAMWGELQQLKQERQQQQTERERYESQQANSEIEAFASDPKNEFFSDVRGDMAILVQSGRAKTLAEAYEMAIYANPDVRQTVLERQFAERETKRKADLAKAVDAKKAAGGSVRSSGTAQLTAASGDETVRQTIERIAAGGGRI